MRTSMGRRCEAGDFEERLVSSKSNSSYKPFFPNGWASVHRQSNQFKQLLLIWAKISPLCNPNYHHQSIWRIFLNKGSSGGRSLLRVCILQGRQEIWQCSAMLLFWWQLLLQDKKKTEAVLWGSVSCSASLQKEGMQFYKSLVLYFCF